jgi:hypothetical protein
MRLSLQGSQGLQYRQNAGALSVLHQNSTTLDVVNLTPFLEPGCRVTAEINQAANALSSGRDLECKCKSAV